MSQATASQTNQKVEPDRSAEVAANPRLSASEAALKCFKQYAKERPEVVALWSFGIGFVLGWKLKLW